MNVDTITQLITTVGFPIVMVGILCWYIYKATSKLGNSLDQIQKQLTLLMEKHGLFDKPEGN